MEEEKKDESNTEQLVETAEKKSTVKEKKSNTWKYILAVIIIIIIILLLIKCCGNGKKYKIKIHVGNDIVEVDKNFKLSDLETEGGTVSFLVDSDGHLVDPDSKLDPKKEYSAHIIPDGKETVNVTYINGDWKKTYKYQKGSGLLFPPDPTKEGYVFIGWKDEEIDDYPIYMTPVNKDMTLVAQFDKSVEKDGVCTLNCDTNKDGVCDLNCDKDGDGKPDTNIDKNGDGICDLNCDADGDGKCDYKCDTNGDGKCDLNCESSNSEMEYTYGEDNVSFDCQSTSFSLFMSKSTELVETKIDGVVVEPDEWNMDANSEQKYAEWNKSISQYFKSGKTIDFVSTLIKKDANDQKYYKISTIKLIFPSKDQCDANKKGETKEVTYKCEDYENDHGFLFTSPVKKDQVKYAKVDGKEITTDKDKDGYPVYDLANYFDDGKTISVEIGYNSPDADGNTSYNAKVLFPVCEFGEVDYTLTLNANGGKVSPTSMKFIRGQIIYDLPYPTRKDYQFVGWYTEKKGGKLVSNETNTEMPEKDMTLYAHWESNKTPSETYTCPDGYELSGAKCTKSTTDTKDAKMTGYSCERGYTLDGDKCKMDVAPVCPSGYEEYGGGCVYLTQMSFTYTCPTEVGTVPLAYDYTTGKCMDDAGGSHDEVTPQKSCAGTVVNGKCGQIQNRTSKETCPSGSTKKDIATAFMCEKVVNATANYSCSEYGNDYKLSGTKCTKTTTETIDATKKTS